MYARKEPSLVHSHLPARNVKPLKNFKSENFQHLSRLGIGFDSNNLVKMAGRFAMDAIQAPVTSGSMAVPVQFLQSWMPGVVEILTAARKIDELVGTSIVGAWEDEQVVQTVLELLGTPQPYGDYTNVPLSSWNPIFETRTVVRFEEGMRVGLLESARASKAAINDANYKRNAALLALEIIRNYIGFLGFNTGANRTYGFLNDPGLPNYVTVANGTSGFPQWSTKTFEEIQRDILTAMAALRVASQDTIDPAVTPITLAVAMGSVDYIYSTSAFGISVAKWLKDAYPNVRVVSAPQLNAANSSANVFYLYADSVGGSDGSTDGGAVFIQPVQAKGRMLGVQQLTKAYIEDYGNATAGVMCKRPFAVIRRSGI